MLSLKMGRSVKQGRVKADHFCHLHSKKHKG